MDNGTRDSLSNQYKTPVRIFTLVIIVLVALLSVTALLAGLRTLPAQASTTKVGLLIDGSLSDLSYSWSAYQGLLRAEQEFGVVGTVYTITETPVFSDVEQCALDGNILCIGVGFSFGGAISGTAEVYSSTNFAVVDFSYENYTANLRGMTFASEQAGYLAGTLAGLMSQSSVIGDIGGWPIPTVIAFTESYSNAAQCANPGITTIISYTNEFSDPDLGALVAQDMISQGADVIFAPAGETGVGSILTATQSGVWAIGVDTDQYYSVFMSGTVPGSNYLLSSAMKRIDNAVFQTISDQVSGSFTPGTVIYDLSKDGVGLAPFHEADASIPDSVKTQLDWVKRALLSGSIEPLNPEGPCLQLHQLYLPITVR